VIPTTMIIVPTSIPPVLRRAGDSAIGVSLPRTTLAS
jgi:hypothetical protein